MFHFSPCMRGMRGRMQNEHEHVSCHQSKVACLNILINIVWMVLSIAKKNSKTCVEYVPLPGTSVPVQNGHVSCHRPNPACLNILINTGSWVLSIAEKIIKTELNTEYMYCYQVLVYQCKMNTCLATSQTLLSGQVAK